MRLARTEKVLWDFILDLMGEELSVVGQRKAWCCCHTRRSLGKTSELFYRIFWQLFREGNVAYPLSETLSCPSRKQWGKLQIYVGGLGEGHSRKVVCQKAQLKCLYTNACSVGNKQEELENMMCLENCDLVAILSWEFGGTNLMTGILLLRATSSSEGDRQDRK